MYWVLNSQLGKRLEKLLLYLEGELRAVFSDYIAPGSIYIFIRVFIFIISSNFIGLFPYVFTCTSHISLTVTLALPI